MVFLAACVQTSALRSQSNSSARQSHTTTPPYHPPGTQETDETSLHLATPEGQSNATTIRPVPTLPGAVKRVEQTPESPITGEVPASLLEEIFHDLSERLKIEIERIEIVKAEEVEWNDGSLGCPQPGEFYTQAVVNGYWLILEVNTVAYDYRASDRGYFFLCERPSLPVIDSPGKQPTEP